MGQNVEKIIGHFGRCVFQLLPCPSHSPTEHERFDLSVGGGDVGIGEQERGTASFHEML
jgi:hypothetical protein